MVEYIINLALKSKKKIRIIYRTNMEISTRVIKPIRKENGYLKAYCYKREAIRRFKIENILSADLLNNKRAELRNEKQST